MIDQLKNIIDYISSPLISFTVLTVSFPFFFPPTNFFDKINKRLGLWKIWTNSGGFLLFLLIS